MTDDQQRARELLAQEYERDGITHVPDCIRREAMLTEMEHRAVRAITAALRAVPEWQPIETAPEGRLVVVGWLDAEDLHYPENYDFDYLEDGLWAKHEDCVEHAHAVAPPGSKMPKEQPPYQWWMDLPAFPAARPQGVK